MRNNLDKIFEGKNVFPNNQAGLIEPLAKLRSKPVLVYGLGECSHWFHEIGMKKFGIKPIFALDKSPQVKKWWGVETATPVAFKRRCNVSLEDFHIIVAVGARHIFNEIKQELLELGYKKIFFLHDFYEFHSFFITDPTQIKNRMIKNFKKYENAWSKLGDELSREIICRMAQVHLTQIPLDIPCSPRTQQYFPLEKKLKFNYQTLVCCGAYDGEIIRQIQALNIYTENILCFEPEPEIFCRLAEFARKNQAGTSDKIMCFHNAVSDKNGIFPFISGDGLGSRLDPFGKSFAQCVKLDDTIFSFEPTFISMDIEGAEVAALTGASQIIKSHAPDLAVCVYHYPEQVSDVIHTISKINKGYNFYIRNYTGFLTETVVYATQKA